VISTGEKHEGVVIPGVPPARQPTTTNDTQRMVQEERERLFREPLRGSGMQLPEWMNAATDER